MYPEGPRAGRHLLDHPEQRARRPAPAKILADADQGDEGALKPVGPVREDAGDLARLLDDEQVVALGVRADERARALGADDLRRQRHDGRQVSRLRVPNPHADRNAPSARFTTGSSPSTTV